MPPIDDVIVPGVSMSGKAIHGWVPQGEKMRGIRQGAPLGGGAGGDVRAAVRSF